MSQLINKKIIVGNGKKFFKYDVVCTRIESNNKKNIIINNFLIYL